MNQLAVPPLDSSEGECVGRALRGGRGGSGRSLRLSAPTDINYKIKEGFDNPLVLLIQGVRGLLLGRLGEGLRGVLGSNCP